MTQHLIPTYNRLPISFVKGSGSWLYDSEGNKYLDALAGIAVCGLGHAHPAVTAAIKQQADNLLHTSNLYGIPNQEALADKLCRLSTLDSAFFCNSGAEANEAAIKLARLYGNNREIENPTIVVAQGAFHGRTMATLSATANPNAQAGFEPLVQGFVRVPYNDIGAIRQLAKTHSNIVAVMIEPIQGEGGIRIPSDDYLPELRKLCDEQEWLLMLDEIQTGIGRTGMFFAYQHANIKPDVLTLAKGLGNGVPIGACLVGGTATELFQPGKHGSTFGGNPLACAAACAVIDTIEQDSGTHFDPEVVAAFFDIFDVIKAIREKFKETGQPFDFRLTSEEAQG
mgnify:CR=1 FL=1